MNKAFFTRYLAACGIFAIGLLPAASLATSGEHDNLLSCVFASSEISGPFASSADDFARFVSFQQLREKGGSKWDEWAWNALFLRFVEELEGIVEPVRAQEFAIALAKVRRRMSEELSIGELLTLCTTLNDPVFFQLHQIGLANAKAVEAISRAKMIGRPPTDTEMQPLNAQLEASQREMQSFTASNRARVTELTSLPVVQRAMLFLQTEALNAHSKIKSILGASAQFKAFLSKWEKLADDGDRDIAQRNEHDTR